jgi:hypothetical protein
LSKLNRRIRKPQDKATAIFINDVEDKLLELNDRIVALENATKSGWLYPVFENDWYDYGFNSTTLDTFDPYKVSFIKDNNGFVHIRGAIRRDSAPAVQVMFYLPKGYRPKKDLYFVVDSSGSQGRLIVGKDGRVQNLTASGYSRITLDNIQFLAEE